MAPLYLARWAILGHLLDHGAYGYPRSVDSPLAPYVLCYVDGPTDDPHPWVRAEATWRLRQLDASEAATTHATSVMGPTINRAQRFSCCGSRSAIIWRTPVGATTTFRWSSEWLSTWLGIHLARAWT